MKEHHPEIVLPEDVEKEVASLVEKEFKGEVTYNFETNRFKYGDKELSVLYNPELVTDLLIYHSLDPIEEVFSVLKTYIKEEIKQNES